jgi:hypothetical protein
LENSNNFSVLGPRFPAFYPETGGKNLINHFLVETVSQMEEVPRESSVAQPEPQHFYGAAIFVDGLPG